MDTLAQTYIEPYFAAIQPYADLFAKDIDFNNLYVKLSAITVVFNPVFWNIVARLEHKTHFLTKIFGNNRYYGCYFLATVIFSLGIYRDHVFKQMLEQQPPSLFFQYVLFNCPAWVTEYHVFDIFKYGLLGFGNILVLSSMYVLGVTGTYLGDYFGILMDEKVTGFPFNIVDNPMYTGSTFSFIAFSLIYEKPAGLVISSLVHSMYSFALIFEEPYTAKIYKGKTVRDTKKSK